MTRSNSLILNMLTQGITQKWKISLLVNSSRFPQSNSKKKYGLKETRLKYWTRFKMSPIRYMWNPVQGLCLKIKLLARMKWIWLWKKMTPHLTQHRVWNLATQRDLLVSSWYRNSSISAIMKFKICLKLMNCLLKPIIE